MKRFKIKLQPNYIEAVNRIKIWNNEKNYDLVLDLSGLNLKRLPKLPNKVINLFCCDNKLTSLPSLQNTIQSLDCSKNNLTSLPSLPISMQMLECGKNNLTSLPDLQCFHPLNNLQILYCRWNNLTSLPNLPKNLKYLDCSINNITHLPKIPNSLRELDCYSNKLTSLPQLPQLNLNTLDCRNNKLISLPTLPNTLEHLKYDYMNSFGKGNSESFYINRVKLNFGCMFVNNMCILNFCNSCGRPLISDDSYCNWKCKLKYKCGFRFKGIEPFELVYD